MATMAKDVLSRSVKDLGLGSWTLTWRLAQLQGHQGYDLRSLLDLGLFTE